MNLTNKMPCIASDYFISIANMNIASLPQSTLKKSRRTESEAGREPLKSVWKR